MDMLAPRGGCDRIPGNQSRFARAGRTHKKSAGAAVGATAEQQVQFRESATHPFLRLALTMLGGDQTRIHREPAGTDGEIVIAVTIFSAAHFDNLQTAAGRT